MFRETPRIVVDTSVLISAILLPESVPAQAARLARQKGVVLITHETLAELAAVLSRPSFVPVISFEERMAYLAAFAAAAELVQVTTHIAACRDPNDDKFLSLAISGAADFIVSGDGDLLSLNPFQSIAILSPRQFVEAIASADVPSGGG